VGLVLVAGLALASSARAGPVLDWLFPDDGPTPAYSCLRYWAPAVGRVQDHFHGPKEAVYAPDRHPEIPVDFTILHYQCPAAVPADTLIPVPTPPPESRFRY
jgi:hypothetical protein